MRKYGQLIVNNNKFSTDRETDSGQNNQIIRFKEQIFTNKRNR